MEFNGTVLGGDSNESDCSEEVSQEVDKWSSRFSSRIQTESFTKKWLLTMTRIRSPRTEIHKIGFVFCLTYWLFFFLLRYNVDSLSVFSDFITTPTSLCICNDNCNSWRCWWTVSLNRYTHFNFHVYGSQSKNKY